MRRDAVAVISMPTCPKPTPEMDPGLDLHRPSSEPLDSALRRWLDQTAAQFDGALQQLQQWHDARVAALQSAAAAARTTLWWPFTQHTSVSNMSVLAITKFCMPAESARKGVHPPLHRRALCGVGWKHAIVNSYDCCAATVVAVLMLPPCFGRKHAPHCTYVIFLGRLPLRARILLAGGL